VPYLPQSATIVHNAGTTYYQWNNIWYTPKIVGGEVVYESA
jgi:hypothetical protein